MLDDRLEFRKEICTINIILVQCGIPWKNSSQLNEEQKTTQAEKGGSARCNVLASPNCGYDLHTAVCRTLFGNRPIWVRFYPCAKGDEYWIHGARR